MKTTTLERPVSETKKSTTRKKKINNEEVIVPLGVNDDSVVCQVFKTYDYSKFIFININRDLDKRNLKYLSVSMAKELYDVPILVTDAKDSDGNIIPGKLWIIDGQHSFTKRQELSKPIFYMYLTRNGSITLTNDYIIEALCALNATSKKWTIIDFINFYAERNYDDYIKLLSLIRKYPDIKSINVYLSIGQGSLRRPSAPKGKSFGYIKDGKYKFRIDSDRVCEWAETLLRFREFEEFRDENFKLALVRIIMMDHLDIDFTDFLARVRKNRGMLKFFKRMDEYLHTFSDIYNKGKREGNGVFFHKEYAAFAAERTKRLQQERRAKEKGTKRDEVVPELLN